MKKLLSLFLALLIIVLMVGCGDKNSDPKNDNGSNNSGSVIIETVPNGPLDPSSSSEPSSSDTSSDDNSTVDSSTDQGGNSNQGGYTPSVHLCISEKRYYFKCTADTHSMVCGCKEHKAEKHNIKNGVCTVCYYGSTVTPFRTTLGRITATDEVFSSKYFIFKISRGIYIIDGLGDYFDKMYEAMEKASGLSFKPHDSFDKVTVVVTREGLGDAGSELGPAYAVGAMREITLSPGDLMLGESYAAPHELAHVLQYDNCNNNFCQTLCEGFSTYTTYKLLNYLEKHDTELFACLTSPDSAKADIWMDLKEFYDHPLDHWFYNLYPEEYSFNRNYSIGFRLMRYLDVTTGSYTAWLKKYTEKYGDSHANDDNISCQYDVVKEVYGATVSDAFYTWLKKNSGWFNLENYIRDYTAISKQALFPKYYFSGYYETVIDGRYSDPLFSLVETKHYLSEYKKENTDNLSIAQTDIPHAVLMVAYDKNGSFLRSGYITTFSLKDVSFIKLIGNGKATLQMYF